MSLNWKEIDLIIKELSLPGAFIQKVRQPNFHSLLFDIYKPVSGRFPLLLELAPQQCRCNRLSHGTPYKTTGKLQRFAQLLRSRIQGGRITESYQLGSDRIILLTLQKNQVITHLYIRLWSNAANIIATDDDDCIIDAFYRRPKKNEISGKHFAPEVYNTPPKKEFSIRQTFYEQGEHPLDFNEFIELTYETKTAGRLFDDLHKEADKSIEAEIVRLERSISIKRKELDALESYEKKKHYGDLLATYRHMMEPHAKWVTLSDYANDNQEITIQLDEKMSPGENIEHYYRAYHKAKGAYERIFEEINHTEEQLIQLQREQEKIRNITDPSDQNISYVKRIIVRNQHIHRTSSEEKPIPGLRFSSRHYTILVGRTAKENDILLRKWTRGNDYWMHTRDYPGGYVFIKYIQGKSVPLETLLDAGNLALYYSKARNNGKADLYYTQVKYLRRAKDSKLGTVLPTNEKNLAIEFDQARLDALFTGDTDA